MAMIIAAGLFVVVFFPNPMNARMIIALTAGGVFLIGWLMNLAGCRSIKKTEKE
jgi:hypothetical protein